MISLGVTKVIKMKWSFIKMGIIKRVKMVMVKDIIQMGGLINLI